MNRLINRRIRSDMFFQFAMPTHSFKLLTALDAVTELRPRVPQRTRDHRSRAVIGRGHRADNRGPARCAGADGTRMRLCAEMVQGVELVSSSTRDVPSMIALYDFQLCEYNMFAIFSKFQFS